MPELHDSFSQKAALAVELLIACRQLQTVTRAVGSISSLDGGGGGTILQGQCFY